MKDKIWILYGWTYFRLRDFVQNLSNKAGIYFELKA